MRTALLSYLVIPLLFCISSCEQMSPKRLAPSQDAAVKIGGSLATLTAVSTTVSNTYSRINDKLDETIFDLFFLVRSPDFLDSCGIKLPERHAVLVISPGTVEGAIKEGDAFSVIANNSEIVRGTIERIITNCEEVGMGIDKLSYGALSLDRAIPWRPRYTSYLAVKGTILTRDMVGIVKSLPHDSEIMYREQIAKEIPSGMDLSINIIYHIALPHSAREFDFVAAEYYLAEEYRTAGDKATRSAGFLFQNGKLILRNDDITRIMAVTDLSNSGVYEVVVHSGHLYSGSYEIRLFDGKKFSEPKKVLYRWMD